MKNVLANSVLVLTRNWVAHELHSCEHVLPMIFTGVCTALDFTDDTMPIPCKWEDWIKLPIRPGDDVIHSTKFSMRCPTVVVLGKYEAVKHSQLKKNLRGIAARDGRKCQYSGRELKPDEMSIDHVVPKSRGGSDDWENLALADKKINHSKGSKLNHEVGLKLLRKPSAPRPMPRAAFLFATHPDHKRFLPH